MLKIVERFWETLTQWEILRDIDRRWVTLRHIETHWETLRDIERCWETLRDVERCWETFRDVERRWEMLRYVQKGYQGSWRVIKKKNWIIDIHKHKENHTSRITTSRILSAMHLFMEYLISYPCYPVSFRFSNYSPRFFQIICDFQVVQLVINLSHLFWWR